MQSTVDRDLVVCARLSGKTSARGSARFVLSPERRRRRERGRRWRRGRLPELVLRRATPAIRDPQACLRPCAATGSTRVQAAEVLAARSTAPEALQDRVHKSSDPADADGARTAAAAASGRTEDSHLRPREETRGGARSRDPDALADAAQQARSLLHPIQDPGETSLRVEPFVGTVRPSI